MGNRLKVVENGRELAQNEGARVLPLRHFIKNLRGAINLGQTVWKTGTEHLNCFTPLWNFELWSIAKKGCLFLVMRSSLDLMCHRFVFLSESCLESNTVLSLWRSCHWIYVFYNIRQFWSCAKLQGDQMLDRSSQRGGLLSTVYQTLYFGRSNCPISSLYKLGYLSQFQERTWLAFISQ